MPARPRVSMITTVRGTAASLFRISIDSVLAQSLEDLELILVLDGDLSEDAEQMVREKADEDDRIVVLRPGHVGRGLALNLGLDAARADLVGIQDADDASHVDRLTIQHEVFRCEPDLALLGTNGKVGRGITATADWPLGSIRRRPRSRLIDMALLRSNPIIHSSVLARRQVIMDVGAYDTRRMAQLDYDLLLRLRESGALIGICDLPLVLHRRHPGQTYEGMSPSSRAWSSYRLQSSHISTLPTSLRLGYQGIAATRLVYQVGRGIAWHRASRHEIAVTSQAQAVPA